MLSALAYGLLIGQTSTRSPLLQRDSLPPQLRAAVDVLGSRVVQPGNERIVTTGAFIKGTKQTTFRVTHELPDKIRIDDMGVGVARSVAYDGNLPWATDQLRDDDLDLLDSLDDDSAETTLYSLQSGSPLRVLGERFRADQGATVNYQGPWLDIFQSYGVAKQRSADNIRQKHLVFDSNSKALLYVRYKIPRGSSTVTVQTEWSAWRRVNGQLVASRVSRRENGAEVWSFSQDQVTIGPALADGVFLHR